MLAVTIMFLQKKINIWIAKLGYLVEYDGFYSLYFPSSPSLSPFSLSLFQSGSVSISLYIYLSISVWLSVSIYLSQSGSLSLSIYLSIWKYYQYLFLSLCLSPSLCFYLSLSVSVWLSVSIYLSLYLKILSVSISLSIYISLIFFLSPRELCYLLFNLLTPYISFNPHILSLISSQNFFLFPSFYLSLSLSLAITLYDLSSLFLSLYK